MPKYKNHREEGRKTINKNLCSKLIEEEENSENKSVVSDIVSNISGTNTEMTLYNQNKILDFYSDVYYLNNNCVTQIIISNTQETIETTGFFINYPSNYIVTSFSCIKNKKYYCDTRIIVHIPYENKNCEAFLVGKDEYNGIALLKLENPVNCFNNCIKWKKSNNNKIGEHILTFNKNNNYLHGQIKSGIITHCNFQKDSLYPESILSSININECCDGQPVFNSESLLIGFITTCNDTKMCLNSFILLNTIHIIHHNTKQKEIYSVNYMKLGIKYEQVTFNDIIDTAYETINGIKITEINKKSNLKKICHKGDIITHMNGIKLGNNEGYYSLTTCLALLNTCENKEDEQVFLTFRTKLQYPIFKTQEIIKVELLKDEKQSDTTFI
jgi:S1-C subfamily serine protease